ncbi:MAG TPA: hypothetical protein VGN57_08880 [Pirellulaceae bacterium]|jgi:hypothetical protein|nr:hypothetical protein [Pirellulaceae bacterium]
MSVPEGKLRFVLLRHELPASSARPSHYDLMLERPSDLFTLELCEPLRSDVSQTARELAPHRKVYLDYEGPVSHDRGEVRAVDRGGLTIVAWTESTVEVDLLGDALRGRLTLTREASREGEPAVWRVSFRAS